MDTNTLENALKLVFGNNTTDNPSSSSKVPYFDSNGLPAGLASMGNLASVLGVDKLYIKTGYDFGSNFENIVENELWSSIPTGHIFLIESGTLSTSKCLAIGYKFGSNNVYSGYYISFCCYGDAGAKFHYMYQNSSWASQNL